MSKQLDHMGVSAFCESMGMMIRSGIQVDEAVDLLQHGRTKTGGILESGLAVIKEHVDNGEGLAAAMKASGIFPDYALQMVEAGETSGKLEGILFRLARYYADQKTISEKLKNAVTYPAVMILLIIVLLAVMIRMVLPSFSAVYERLTGSLAASSYGYVRWAYVFCWIALIALIIIAAALLIGYRMWKGGKRESVEALLRKSPVCASILENMAMFRFTSALATFIASGDMQDEAVEKSIPMADYGPVEEKLKRVASGMLEGHSIAQAAYDEELFEPTYGRMLLAGERSGNLENVLERLTDLLEENCSNEVDRLVGFVDPLLSGILMVTVGLSLLSVMLPLIGMMNSVG
ncbi:MAG: type II secretion system F family protein [Firmicutes bacterium]|nr:type II secretion system F family protein [Bacillota bacterium]MBQ2147887.1 type II secretion system F family protein [Bacillota bacterium]MBQ4004133.1 type II secretion system F family protein [Bacillota bacterium]